MKCYCCGSFRVYCSWKKVQIGKINPDYTLGEVEICPDCGTNFYTRETSDIIEIAFKKYKERNLKNYVQVKFKKLTEDAQIFEYKTIGAVGADIYSNEEVILQPTTPTIIKTGIAVQLPEGYEMQIRCRSGLATKGFMLANGVGTVDEDFRAEIGVIMINTNDIPKKIEKGDRIAQAVIAPVIKADYIEVTELNDTERGSGGFVS